MSEDTIPSSAYISKKSRLWDHMRECSDEARVGEDAVEAMEGRIQLLVDIVAGDAKEHAYKDDMKTIKARHVLDAFDERFRN